VSIDLTSVASITSAVRARGITARALVDASLSRAGALNPKLNAIVELLPEQAHKQAAVIDAKLSAGQDPGPLAGVPVILKDNICLSWGKTTCGSAMLRDYHSPFTATSAQKLIDAGAIVIAKANCDEFAMGSSTEHSCHGPTRNPWDTSRVPGGSSGGSAAVVSAGIVPASLGSDTGGSIRQPASHCGVVGIKPTYGRVSRWGLVAYASSLDQIGPFTNSVHDAAIMLDAICGFDPHDSTSAQLPATTFTRDLDMPIQGMKIGLPRQVHSPANSVGVSKCLGASVEALRSLGAEIVDIDLPNVTHGIAAYYLIATAEASSNLARFDGIRYGHRAKLAPGEDLFDLYCKSRSEGFGPEVQRRIMLGTHALSSGYYDAYYLTALKVRRLIKQDYDHAFKLGCQAILMPAAPGPAFKLGEKAADPLAMYLEDVYTVGVNLAGLPGITVPTGFELVDGARLPIGMQLIGAALDESRLLRIARALESALAINARPALT
jgi:aspartyl-tRNA(Asn)/glutamyl-tRNA(Gln) amidotransferase subunit A